MFVASGSGSMLHNPAGRNNYKVHTSFLKKIKKKQSPRIESFHRVNHYSVSDRSSEHAPLKIKIIASKGKVEVINSITSEQLSSIKSSVSPKPGKPKKTEKEYLNTVALANEPVYEGIADSVKTKKRECKDRRIIVYSPESSSSRNPKKQKPRKKIETKAPPKKWKSETSLYQKSNVQNDRKSLGTSLKLYKEQDKKNVWTSRHLYNENYKKKKASRQLCDRQDNRKNVWSSRELYNDQDKKEGCGTSKELYNKQNNRKSVGISRERYNRIETKSSIISYPTLILKRKTLDPTPAPYVATSSITCNPTLILKRKALDPTSAVIVSASSINPIPSLIPKREKLDQMPPFDVTTSSVIPSPAFIPTRETLDLTPPYDLIFEIERDFFQKCNTICLKKVECTVTDPVFKNVTTKFQESSERVVSEYLADGYPNVEEMEKVTFEPVLAEKIQHSQGSFNPCASPGNVFLSCASSQELVIASYEDAVEVEMKAETNSHCLESPPYGSQDSGYTSMTSPFSDDPEYPIATDSKPVGQADRPFCLTDVQFLKMCHDYSKFGGSKKWFTKKLVNNHNSKTSPQFRKNMNNPTTKKNSQLSMIKIMSNKCIPHEESRKGFSPRGNEHAKALLDRRVVYLGNIPSTYTVQYLREKFKRFGEIENIQIKSKDDELDIVDSRLLASQPLKGNSRNSGKGNVHKGKIMKHFGFVTFKKIAVAREVFEKRGVLCTWAGGSINYGGRREFVREDYADFDAEANNLNPGCSYKQNQENEVDYTQLLKKEQEKRGLIISPNSKRPQHSV